MVSSDLCIDCECFDALAYMLPRLHARFAPTAIYTYARTMRATNTKKVAVIVLFRRARLVDVLGEPLSTNCVIEFIGSVSPSVCTSGKPKNNRRFEPIFVYVFRRDCYFFSCISNFHPLVSSFLRSFIHK